MKFTKNIAIAFLILLSSSFVFSCSKKKQELKSPCVAASGANLNQNPCENRINPNFNWLQRV